MGYCNFECSSWKWKCVALLVSWASQVEYSAVMLYMDYVEINPLLFGGTCAVKSGYRIQDYLLTLLFFSP